MEWHGSERASSSQAEQNSLLDVPWVVTPESFLLNPNPGKDDAVDVPLSPVADTGYFPTGSNCQFFPGSLPCLGERAESTSCKNTEHFQPSETDVHEQRQEGDSTLRKSLETFYNTWCQKKPFGGSPVYESTSQCLAVKTADLAGKEGMKFTVKSLQVAQMVLNREESKIFPQTPNHHGCFLTPISAGASSEKREPIPGLSDDIHRFILKQNVTLGSGPENISIM